MCKLDGRRYGKSFGKEDGMSTTHVSDASFDTDVLKSTQPVLVDFWAALEEIAQELDGKLKVVKVDIDRNSATPKKYGIRGVPTLMLFKDGQVAATKVGAEPKRKLLDWVNSVI
jgi:thioredoxin 1